MHGTIRKWFSVGYNAGMNDILTKLEEEGPEQAIQWAKDNYNPNAPVDCP